MCKILKIPHSTLRKKMNNKITKQEIRRAEISNEILNIYVKSKKIYGAPKIFKELIKKGIKVSLKFVQRRMSELNIKSKIVRNFKHFSTKIDINGKVNILCQNFIATKINQKLCADITYIWTKEDGWTYLAKVIDLYSKKIIGFAYSKVMTTELAISAVKNALSKIKNTKEIILHTDLGSQFLSNKFESFISKYGIIHSYSRRSCPYDNSPIESFHAILKKEEVTKDNVYKNFEEAKLHLENYIENWYNNEIIHSSIGYRTPNEVYYEKIA